MDYWNLESLFSIQSMRLTKPRNRFKNGGDQIFSQICRGDESSQNQGNFELKISIMAAINIIRGVKSWIFDLKILPSLSLWTRNLHKLMELNSDEASSRNPSLDEISQPSALAGPSLQTGEGGYLKNR